MARVSPLMVLPPLLLVGLAALFYIGLGEAGDTTLPSTRIDKPAPALSLTQLGDLAEFDGAALRKPGVKLVNFWASWCVPCRAEHPMLEKMARQGVTIYGIDYKDDPKKARALLAELGNPYAGIGADAKGRTAIEWGIYGVPETFVIDGSGTVLLRHVGPITKKILATTIGPAMARAK